MTASNSDIREWLRQAQEQKATHLIMVCDTYDWEDYPVYVQEGQDPREEAAKYGTNSLRVMEVYSLSKDLESQIAEHRAFHFD